MSIIQDALRRSDPARPPPLSPPRQGPASFRPRSPPPGPAKKSSIAPLLIVLVLVLLVGAGFYGYRSGWFDRFRSEESPALESGLRPDVESDPPLTARPAEESAGVSAPTPEMPGTAPAEPLTAADAPPAAGAEKPVETAGPSVPAPKPEPPPPPREVRPRWPRFAVKGIMAGGRAKGRVFLDSVEIEEGQSTADGVRVVRVAGDSVVLEYRSEERAFRVGSRSE